MRFANDGTTSVTIDLPNPLVQQLESIAREQHRSVSEMVRERLLQTWPSLPALPDDVEMELALFTGLSDDVLWRSLSRSAVSDREELANVNTLAQQRVLMQFWNKRVNKPYLTPMTESWCAADKRLYCLNNAVTIYQIPVYYDCNEYNLYCTLATDNL